MILPQRAIFAAMVASLLPLATIRGPALKIRSQKHTLVPEYPHRTAKLMKLEMTKKILAYASVMPIM